MNATGIPQARQGRRGLGAAARLSALLLPLGAALFLLCTSTAASVDATPRWSVQGPSAEMLRGAAVPPPAVPPLAAPTIQASAASDASPPPAAPAPELLDVGNCQALIDSLFSNCAVSIDRISMSYSRGSERPPTAEEQADALLGLKAAGLPPARCARSVLPFLCGPQLT